MLDTGHGAVVVLPGPPSELQRLWPNALETDAGAAGARAPRVPPGRRVLRFYGASESAVAKALADAGGDGDGVEATICAREFEIHVDLLVDPGAEARGEELEQALVEPLERYLFARDERRGRGARARPLPRARAGRSATAESCTGGLVAGRLTSVPGSSDVFKGGDRRVRERGEGGGARRACGDVLAAHGAVSAETAAAMAAGVRARLGVDVGVA